MLKDNLLLYRIGQFIAVSLPLRIAYKFSGLIAYIYYLFAKEDRKCVAANLKVIFPEKTHAEITRIRSELFKNFAKYLVDFFRFQKIDLNFVKTRVGLENKEYFEQALEKGRGAIILSAHIGNWEFGGITLGVLGYPISAVALEHQDKRVDNFFNYQRESRGLKVIPFSQAARQCLKALTNNQLLALVGDRVFSENGRVIDLFGKPTLLPEGPAVFTLRTGTALIPGFMIRNKDDSLTLRFEKPIEFTPSGNNERDIKDLMSKYKLVIEDYIRKYPGQWYMFKKFWIQ